MAGNKKKRARILALQSAPPHSWIHSKHYSVGSPQDIVYLLCTPHGPLTAKQEYFCWVFASTGKLRMSRRMVYGLHAHKEISPSERARVADLIDMNDNGVIDLAKGPWDYYGFPIGDPTNYIKPMPKDYSKCLTPLTTYQTTT